LSAFHKAEIRPEYSDKPDKTEHAGHGIEQLEIGAGAKQPIVKR
jgi:hypothetical protein